MSTRRAVSLLAVIAGCDLFEQRGSAEAPPAPEESTRTPSLPPRTRGGRDAGGLAPGAVQVVEARRIVVMHVGSYRAPATVRRTHEEARSRAREALFRARAGEDFGALVARYSDEPGAAERAGAMGRVPRGVIDPELDQALFALRPGEVSDPVETREGYHILQRVDPSRPPVAPTSPLAQWGFARARVELGPVRALGDPHGHVEATVDRVLRLRVSIFRLCHEHTLRFRPDTTIRGALRFSVTDRGRVAAVELQGAEAEPDLAQCIRSALQRTVFHPAAGIGEFEATLSLAPESARDQ